MSKIIPVIPELFNNQTVSGELRTSEPTPMAQITAQYGFTSSIFNTGLAGNQTNLNGMFQATTTTSGNSVSVVSTNKQVSVKSGQGLFGRLSAIFDTPAANNTQFAGLQTSESLIGFGYDGLDFGIGFASGGALAINDLQITVGATANETATVTIDSNVYNVPITNSTINQNAYEIAEYLNANAGGYNFASNNDIVTAMALLPDLGGGTFSFSSATCVGAFTNKATGAVPTERWTKKADWNVYPDIELDPHKGNEYAVQYAHLGFGNTRFYIRDTKTDNYELVHVDKYANNNTIPSVPNPIFRCGWATRNTGNTTVITVQGAGAQIDIEGKYIVHGEPTGYCNIKNITTGAIRNILSVRNRMTFNNLPNRLELFLKDLSMSVDSTKIVNFYVYKNIVASTHLNWFFVDAVEKLTEVAANDTDVTSGNLIACFSTKSDLIVNLSDVLETLEPQDHITIAAELSSGAAVDVAVSVSVVEDL